MTSPTNPAARWYTTLREQWGTPHGWPLAMAAQAVADATIAHLNADNAPGASTLTASDPVWSVIALEAYQQLVAHEDAAHPTLTLNQPPPCRLDRDELSAWLTRPGPGGTTLAQRLQIDDTFTTDNPNLGDRLWRLVVEAQEAEVFGVPGHGIEVWQLADAAPVTGYLISVQPPDGPELVDGTIAAQTLLGYDATGVPAAVNALTTIAHRTDAVLAEHTRLLHAHRPAPTNRAPACAADPRRIRDWLASPSTDPGFTSETVADVWDFGTTFTTDPAHHAVNLVDQAQQAGVFGIPGHHITLLHVPGDEDIDADGYLLLVDTPGGQRLCSDWLRLDELVAPDLAGRRAAIDCLTSLASTVDAVLTVPSSAASQRPAEPTASRVAGAFPPPGTPATANPPPPTAPTPAASERRYR